jgi:hypothetical protein
VHKLMGPEVFLWPLPKNLRIEVATTALNLGEYSVKILFYVNIKIVLRAQENPRLWELPEDWESYTDTYGLLWFKNTRTQKR